MDGSVVGRGCAALMIHVISKGRALPLAWRVRQGPKGHFPEDLHIAVVELISEVIPEGAKVVFLGDGACDGTALQATLNEAGWSYACRTALSTVATWEGVTFRLDTLGACRKPGTLIELKEVQFTRERLWAGDGAELLGQGVSRSAVFGQQYGRRRGGVPLLSKAFPHRDLFLRPEKSRFPSSQVTYIRPAAPLAIIDRSVFSVYMDCLFRVVVRKRGMEKCHSSQ